MAEAVTTIRPIPDRPWEREATPVQDDDRPWEREALALDGTPALLGGAGATIGPAPDDGQGLARVWQEAARKLKEHIFGHPDRAEARAAGIGLQPTPAELVEAALAGGSAMMGGATMGGLAAGPSRAALVAGAKGLAKGYAGAEVGEGVGHVAEGLGAPEGTATAAKLAGGLVGGVGPTRVGGAIRNRVMGRAAAAEAAPLLSDGPRTLHVPEGMPAQAGGGRVLQMPAPQAAQSAAVTQMEEITAKVVSLREKGLSGAQITSALRQMYGIPPGQGQKMVDMVLESQLMKGTAPRAAAASVAPAKVAAESMAEEIAALSQRGLSAQQIADSIRRTHLIPHSKAWQAVNEVLQSSGGSRVR